MMWCKSPVLANIYFISEDVTTLVTTVQHSTLGARQLGGFLPGPRQSSPHCCTPTPGRYSIQYTVYTRQVQCTLHCVHQGGTVHSTLCTTGRYSAVEDCHRNCFRTCKFYQSFFCCFWSVVSKYIFLFSF